MILEQCDIKNCIVLHLLIYFLKNDFGLQKWEHILLAKFEIGAKNFQQKEFQVKLFSTYLHIYKILKMK